MYIIVPTTARKPTPSIHIVMVSRNATKPLSTCVVGSFGSVIITPVHLLQKPFLFSWLLFVLVLKLRQGRLLMFSSPLLN